MILVLVTVLLLVALTLGAYADRVYAELGKFLARESQDNVDAWIERIEPGFGLSRDSIALSGDHSPHQRCGCTVAAAWALRCCTGVARRRVADHAG